MKKLFLVSLTFVLVFGLSTMAMAEGLDVSFNVTNPNITVTAYKGPAGVYSYEGTASFTLTGTGSASGSIVSTTNGPLWSWGPCPGHPKVSGGYTASGGDFTSMFNANSYMLDGPSSFGHGYWSTHSIDATGVPTGSMTVTGDATAFFGGGYGSFVEGGQTFSGTAESVEVFGSKMDSTKQGIDPATWNPDLFKGAEFTGTALGDSTFQFSGSTDAGTYPQGGETSPCRVASKQGLGFELGINGSSLYGSLVTTYSYTNTMVQPNWIIGDTSTNFTGVPGGGYYEWAGVPGYLTN